MTTLGSLFMDLGDKYTAKAIYAFYRTRRLAAVKRQKSVTAPQGAPGSRAANGGRGPAGTTGSVFQATVIQREHTNADALVAEYIHVKRLSPEQSNTRAPIPFAEMP